MCAERAIVRYQAREEEGTEGEEKGFETVRHRWFSNKLLRRGGAKLVMRVGRSKEGEK